MQLTLEMKQVLFGKQTTHPVSPTCLHRIAMHTDRLLRNAMRLYIFLMCFQNVLLRESSNETKNQQEDKNTK